MATIEKRGNGYRITVSHGYNLAGKQLRHRMTWTPAPGMTQRQIDKELNRQATLFEEKVIQGTNVDNRIRFAAFAEQFMQEYGALYLKPKTFQTYTEHLRVINTALGHIKLCELHAPHINRFYKNLQESGVRTKVTANCKIDMAAWLQAHNSSSAALAVKAGLSRATVRAVLNGDRISGESACKLAAAMNMDPNACFDIQANAAPLAASSVRSYHRTLSSILSKAVQWGYLQDNPAEKADKPPTGRKEAPYLEEADARRLLELLQQEPIRWKAVLTFDLLSGLRRGEVLGLRWCDVDFDAGTITVRQTSNYLPGKGVYTSTPKTDASIRPLRLSRAAMALLLEYKSWQDAQCRALGDAWEDRDGRVFTTDSGAPIFPDSVTQWFSRFVKRVGLPPITVHSLRHTYATLMIADGVPLVVVSRQLGHAQSSTTANIYAHAIASAQAKAAQTFDRFNDVLSSPGKPQVNPKTKTG